MEQEEKTLELVLFLYADPRRADEALEKARQLKKTGEVRLVDAAVILKEADGKARFHEIHDLTAWRGTLFGFVAGAMIGLLGGPVGALVGGVLGAATGGVVAGGLDLGFSDDFLSELEGALRPGHSALLTIVELPYDEALIKALEPLLGRVYRHLLKADVVERLLQEQSGQGE